ncbi:MAG: hypothetical protein JRH19_27010 [Deltaproteobacteria bacterium]|nr:hypothetical protein [Deltaproteobacteria bacterium]
MRTTKTTSSDLPRALALVLAGALLSMVAGSLQAEETGATKAPPMQITKEAIASRLGNVDRLITISSGAQRVEASGNPDALAKQAEARELHAKAKKSFRKGRYAEATELLDQATAAIFTAIRSAGAEQENSDKKRHDFEARASSVEVLLEALRRISAEKHQEKRNASTIAKVETQYAQAQKLAAAGEMDEARAVIDDAYAIAKSVLVGLRDGDTVVRTLSFESPAEEYRYEIDRNDTHIMLITVLLGEKRQSNKGVDTMVTKFMERADVLRKEAEGQAGEGNYEAAVETLDRSTKELVRAIRSAGVYIPG